MNVPKIVDCHECFCCPFQGDVVAPTVDGSEIRREHQLRLAVYPTIYKVFSTIPGGCLGFLKHQPYHKFLN